MNSTHIANLQDLADLIGNLTLEEAYELREILKEKFHLTENEAVFIPMIHAFPSCPNYKVELISYGPEKIKAIKVVKNLNGMGLTEAKFLVENLPKILKEDISLAEAEKIKEEFESFGATVKITEFI